MTQSSGSAATRTSSPVSVTTVECNKPLLTVSKYPPVTSTYPSDPGDYSQFFTHPIVKEDTLMVPTSEPYFPMPYYLPLYEMDASRRDLHPRLNNQSGGQYAEHRSVRTDDRAIFSISLTRYSITQV